MSAIGRGSVKTRWKGCGEGAEDDAHGDSSSEPDPGAEDEAKIARALAGLPCKIRRLPEFPLIDDAEIGRKISGDLKP
jgi:hypothetical protein